ncbi:MAG TPA: hypothetical protein VF281_00700 [Candidatus Saccharimonadales bacterium]
METREKKDKVVKQKIVRKITTAHELKLLMQHNNPRNEPVGILTGRCKNCGSQEIWAHDHPKAIGCNCCGFTYSTDRTN